MCKRISNRKGKGGARSRRTWNQHLRRRRFVGASASVPVATVTSPRRVPGPSRRSIVNRVMNPVRRFFRGFASSVVLVAFLGACGGGSTPPGPDPILSLDGIYRGSPVVVSADGFTYDYETGGSPWNHYGNVGRIYTTTVNPNDTIDGTATIYTNGEINTAALTGTITPAGAMTINFIDGASNVSVVTQRIAQASTTLQGRAFCTIEPDNVTVHDCGEFDVLNSLVFRTPSHGPGGSGESNLVALELGAEVSPDVYEATVDWSVCRSLSGLASFAVSEDGVYDELAITVVGGNCGFVWWVLRTTR